MKSADGQPLILGEFLPYRLSVVTEAVSRLFAERYEARFGLTIPEWRVMAAVGESAPRTTGEVIATTRMDRVKVSRAVIRLGDKGLLDRRADPRDARAQVLSLTAEGEAAYRAIVPLARDLQAALAAALTAEEAAALAAILGKLDARAAALAGDQAVASR